MSYYGDSQRGSRDDLDDLYAQRHQAVPPRATPRQSQSSVNPPSRNPESSYASTRQPPGYDRQFERRPPPQPQERPAFYTPGSRQPPRSHSPQRYDERPGEQYMPARSASPSSFQGARDAIPVARYQPPRPSQTRSQSPGRTLDEGYQSRPLGGPHDFPGAGYDRGASNAGYDQYSPQRPTRESADKQPPYRPPSSLQPASYGRPAPKPQYYQQQPPPMRNYKGYQPIQEGKSRYATQYSKPLHKSVTRDGGYYNVYTDAVIRTKKYKTKTGASTFLAVTRPWSKNHSNQPRDYMPLVIAAMFFNPLFGLAGLVLSCLTRRAVTQENWARAGVYGRVTFWLSIAAIILGIIFWIALIGAVHNDFFAPKIH